MKITEKFPPLYECSACGLPVTVVPVDGKEPEKIFKCSHTDAIIWANRKVTLIGKGDLTQSLKARVKIRLTIRQLLSCLTGRSI
jgi:hypothetical protein